MTGKKLTNCKFGFADIDRLVMSDWCGINSTVESIEAGCDIEMPAGQWRGEKVSTAVKDGKLSAEAVEKAAANVLYMVERTRGSDMSIEPAERENDREETRQLIRDAGAEGLTLLKNEGSLLPIKPSQTKIAVIGPNANRAIAGGGGSASLNPYYKTIPLESIKAVPGKEVSYSQGCHTWKWLPLAQDYCTTATGVQGVVLEFFEGDKFQGKPRVIQHKTNTDLYLWDSAPQEVLPAWSCYAKTRITPVTSGNHTIGFSSVGAGRLFVEGELKVDLWNWTEEGEAMFEGSKDVLFEMQMEAGKPYELLVEMTNEKRPLTKTGATHRYGGCRIGYKEQDQVNYMQEAIDAAAESDVAVVIVGLDEEWESEGYDRQTMDLPKDGSQDRLIEAVLTANPNTIVVNQSGSPVTMPWADRVPAILQAWYQGQEAGNALADVLFGLKNPSGKLPVRPLGHYSRYEMLIQLQTTFPKRLEDNPTYHNWPGENLKVIYGEGLYIGYRHYERVGIEPLFPFGHGLSYTTFSYGAPTISSLVLTEPDKIMITIPVTNSGSVEGAEIVQAYIHDEESRLPRPEKELQAFDKVFLKPGETKDAILTLDKYSVGYYDTNLNAWIAEAGVFEVLIGASSVDIKYVPSINLSFLSALAFLDLPDASSLGEVHRSKSRSHLLGCFRGRES
jgi:beta-glucosidase